MNIRLTATLLIVLLATAPSLSQTPLGTAFTYQGQLKQSGSPVNGTANLDFSLWNDPAATNPSSQIGSTQSFAGVTVTGGLFTVQLNAGGEFGPDAFNSEERWLEIAVNGTTLSPRQGLTAAPYSHFSKAGSATQLQARAVSSAAPVVGQTLKWDGAQWGPAADSNTTYAAGAGLGLAGNVFSIANNGVTNVMLASDAASLSKVSGGAMFTNGSFVGIGTNTPIGAASFVLNQNTTTFGGMYISTQATGRPFYGYSLNGGLTAYHYIDGDDGNKWKLYNSGVQVTVTTNGDVGLGTTSPSARLDVRVPGPFATGLSSQVNGASGIDNPLGSGVWGDSNSTAGVFGSSSAGYGVAGISSANGGAGVLGSSHDDIGSSIGVLGQNSSLHGYGVYGRNYYTGSGIATTYGVYGEADAWNGCGVYGLAGSSSTNGTNYGVYGQTDSNSGYAGYFVGRVNITGTLFKGGGAFKIDHPLDPANKYLSHSFVESPDMKNIYDGVVTTDAQGYATVTLPDWFEALNRDFRYQLTVLDGGSDGDEWVMARVARKIHSNQFTIRTSQPNVEVSWQVTGIRHDAFANAHRIAVEEDKTGDQRGQYLYPKEHGQPIERGIDHQRMQRHPALQTPAAAEPTGAVGSARADH